MDSANTLRAVVGILVGYACVGLAVYLILWFYDRWIGDGHLDMNGAVMGATVWPFSIAYVICYAVLYLVLWRGLRWIFNSGEEWVAMTFLSTVVESDPRGVLHKARGPYRSTLYWIEVHDPSGKRYRHWIDNEVAFGGHERGSASVQAALAWMAGVAKSDYTPFKEA